MSRARAGAFPLGGGGGLVDQGAPGLAANAWPVSLAIGGVLYDARLIRLLTAADVVSLAGGTSVDVTDRVGRLLGVVASITAPVDVSDRVGRLLGIIASITAPVDISDRVARVLGQLTDGAAAYVAAKTGQLPAALVGGRLDANAGAWLGSVAPTVGQKTMANSLPVTLASDQSTPLPASAERRAALLHVTGTAAVNTGLTVTLPAVAGQFHYITSVQWHKLYSVIGVAAGAGVIITSTNLPGGPAWTTEQVVGVAGSVVRVIDYQPTTPLRSSVVNTATTIVAPAQLQTIWRGNVSYFTAV